MLDLVVHVAGWTLLHFLWEGTVIGLTLAVAIFLLRRADPRTRYAACLIGLGALAVVPAATAVVVLATMRSGVMEAASAPAVTLWARLEPALPWLVGGWACGAVLLHARLLAAWIVTLRLRRSSCAAPARWVDDTADMASVLGLRQAPPVRLSDRIDVPMLVGWLVPVVLVPVSALTGLTGAQLRAVVAHELAHVRRRDHLVNLAQVAIEAILFYHPAVWWVSSRLRAEREYCCDDLAVATCGDAMNYARALARLEELRGPRVDLALASTGGPLMSRIVRLVQAPTEPGLRWGGFVAPAVAAAILTVTMAGAAVSIDDAPPPKVVPPSAAAQVDLAHVVAKYDAPRAALVEVLQAAGISPKTVLQVLEEGGASEETLVAVRKVVKHQELFAEAMAPVTAKVKAAYAAGRISAVEAELAIEQARAEVVERFHAERSRASQAELMARHDAMAKRLKEAMARGEITEEEARRKMYAYVAELKKYADPDVRLKAHHESELQKVKRAYAEIKAELEAGRISEEEAQRSLEELHARAEVVRRNMEKARGFEKAHPEVLEIRAGLEARAAEIHAAYEEGLITKEEAAIKFRKVEADYARKLADRKDGTR